MQNRDALAARYSQVREHSLALSAPLGVEDQCIQPMPDASPTKWHLAHTTWFFERLVLEPYSLGYRPYDSRFGYLFNSYYESLGARQPRPLRGLLARPSLSDVHAWRRHVDSAVERLLRQIDDGLLPMLGNVLELGIQHEQQHQELMLTDILYTFFCNPLLPAYHANARESAQENPHPASASEQSSRWIELSGGVVEVGHDAHATAFAFDNEKPAHKVMLQPCALADRLVTCGEFAKFIEDGGYRRPELWLFDGWAAVQAGGWQHPLYWFPADAPQLVFAQSAQSVGRSNGNHHWYTFGLDGIQPLQADAPVSQVSFFEAAAYAAWSGARLPTEFEWEAASMQPGMRQLTQHAWQWTRSSYDPYPGFRPLTGAASEYNGKFMVGQMVLRGSSIATPAGHTRATYRNFFPPAARWQFSGIRVAQDI